MELGTTLMLNASTAEPRSASAIQMLNIELPREKSAKAGSFRVTSLMAGGRLKVYHFLRTGAKGAGLGARL